MMFIHAHVLLHDEPHLHPYPTGGRAWTTTGPSILRENRGARAFISKSSITQMLSQDIFCSRASQNVRPPAPYRLNRPPRASLPTPAMACEHTLQTSYDLAQGGYRKSRSSGEAGFRERLSYMRLGGREYTRRSVDKPTNEVRHFYENRQTKETLINLGDAPAGPRRLNH